VQVNTEFTCEAFNVGEVLFHHREADTMLVASKLQCRCHKAKEHCLQCKELNPSLRNTQASDKDHSSKKYETEWVFEHDTVPVNNPEPNCNGDLGNLHITGWESLRFPGVYDQKARMYRRCWTANPSERGATFSLFEDVPDDPNLCGGEMTIWPAALVLARYIEQVLSRSIRRKRVVELGAGAGLVSMTASLCGATVIATEKEDSMDFLIKNLKANENRVNVQPEVLRWGTEGSLGSKHREKFDFIFGSDITYDKNLHEALCETMANLSEKQTVIYLCHDHESTPDCLQSLNAFKKTVVKQGVFHFSCIDASLFVPQHYQKNNVSLCVLNFKA